MSQNTRFCAIFWYKIIICAIVYAFSAMFKTYNFACSQVVTISPLISELFLQYKSPMSTVHMWAVGEVRAKKSSFPRQVCKGILSVGRAANVKEDPQRKLSRNCKNINLAVGISKPAFYTSWRSRTNSILHRAKQIRQGGVGKSLNAGGRRTSCPMGGVDMKRGVGSARNIFCSISLPFPEAFFLEDVLPASQIIRCLPQSNEGSSRKEWILSYKAAILSRYIISSCQLLNI